MKKAFSCLLILLSIWQLPVNAQQITHTGPGGLKMGFGMGSSWLSSDIKNSKGFGVDVWLGTPLYQRDNAFFALDWRLHFLAGSNSAYDHMVNTDGSYSNVQLRHFSYDLEFLLTLNRLREQTGIILGGFLGAGLTHGLVSADLLDASNNAYDYSTILPGQDRSEILAVLDQLTDSEFETRLHSKASILPTAGVQLGYQFSPRFALGVEYKMNISLNEQNSLFGIDMDGRVSEGSSPDWNNYASLVFRWTLRGKSGNKDHKADPATVQPDPVFPPQVDFTVPHDNPHRTADSVLKVNARVINIARQSDITVRLNGQIQEFRFYNSISSVEIQPSLQPGSNSLEIYAGNEAGSDTDQLELIFSKQEEAPGTVGQEAAVIGNAAPGQGFPPNVTILSPSERVGYYSTPAAEILAEITQIESPGDISLSIDGIGIDAFTYDFRTNMLTAIVPLNSSSNRMTLKAQNRFGSDRDSRTLIREGLSYVPTSQLITNAPVQNPVTVQQSNQPVTTGTVQPVTTGTVQVVSADPGQPVRTGPRQAVVVDPKDTGSGRGRPVRTEPGQPVPPDPPVPGPVVPPVPGPVVPPVPGPVVPPVPGRVDPPVPGPVVPPVPGPVVPPVPGPVDPCLAPSVLMKVSAVSSASATHVVSARIQEVDQRENISLTVNGSMLGNFSFNPASKELRANLKLDPGANTISIVATNHCGEYRASETVTVESQGGENPGGTDAEQGWVRINPGNASWEFCLQTGSGTYNRSDLSNSGFSYSGPASSLYFKPIAGGGSALVNGMAYNLNPGQYYLFTGNLKVRVTNKRQGAMGQWSVYIESSSSPSTGQGKGRPQSPCDSGDKKTDR